MQLGIAARGTDLSFGTLVVKSFCRFAECRVSSAQLTVPQGLSEICGPMVGVLNMQRSPAAAAHSVVVLVHPASRLLCHTNRGDLRGRDADNTPPP